MRQYRHVLSTHSGYPVGLKLCLTCASVMFDRLQLIDTWPSLAGSTPCPAKHTRECSLATACSVAAVLCSHKDERCAATQTLLVSSLMVVCRQRHATPDDPQHYADVMYEYYTALYQGTTGGAQPEHARDVARTRRDQQVRRGVASSAVHSLPLGVRQGLVAR